MNHTVPIRLFNTHARGKQRNKRCAWIYRREQQKSKDENEVGIGLWRFYTDILNVLKHNFMGVGKTAHTLRTCAPV